MAIRSDGEESSAVAGAPGLPAWRRRTEGEQRWWIVLAMAGAIVLQTVVPARFASHPRYLLPGIEAVALIAIVALHPDRMSRRSTATRRFSLALAAAIALTNLAAAIELVRALIASHNHVTASELLVGGGEIWLTNVIVFAIWYWEFDRGGPTERALGTAETPDLLFPQLSDDQLSKDWEPIFMDYLFVSFTNSTAFSPTDTMPLSRGAKALFMLQSGISLVTVLLIAARAVNILPGQ